MGLEFLNENQVKLHAIDLYLPTVERLKRLYEAVGIEEVGDRERITTTNTKTCFCLEKTSTKFIFAHHQLLHSLNP